MFSSPAHCWRHPGLVRHRFCTRNALPKDGYLDIWISGKGFILSPFHGQVIIFVCMHLKWMSQDCCFALVQRILGGSLGSNLIEVNDYDDSDRNEDEDDYRAQVPFGCQR